MLPVLASAGVLDSPYGNGNPRLGTLDQDQQSDQDALLGAPVPSGDWRHARSTSALSTALSQKRLQLCGYIC